MLKFKLTDDKQWLEIIEYDDMDLIRFKSTFRKLDKSHFADPSYKSGDWDGFEPFLIGNRYVASGLWYEVYQHCNVENIQVVIDGLDDILKSFPFEDEEEQEFEGFISKLFEGLDKSPRLYQIEAAKRVLRYKFANTEVATAAGKTMVLFIVAAWLKWKGLLNPEMKMLIITSRVQLLYQIKDEFENEYNNGTIELKPIIVGGKKDKFNQKLYDECEICIISYQSLRTRTEDFYTPIYNIGVDEAHTAKGKNIPNAILSCKNLITRFGVSGTIKVDEKYSIFYKIQQYLGPLVMRYQAHQLIADGYAPEVNVRVIALNYKNVLTPDIIEYRNLLSSAKEMYDDPIDFGKEMYSIENSLVRQNEARLRFIAKLVNRLDGNVLILFNDVVGEYGKRITEVCKTTGKKCEYIDGQIDVDIRGAYTKLMEENDDMVLIASFGTYSTGINLKNVKHIILAESYKAEILIRQTIGRGMRQLVNKLFINLIDLCDTFGKYGKSHLRERLAIYKKNKFKVTKYEVFLS